MHIGVPREIKPGEGRVALLPDQVSQLCERGHQVTVERDAGIHSAADDHAYLQAGARIASNAAEVYGECQLIVKVKEILPVEFELLRPRHIVFTNLHSAADPVQLDRLLEVGLTAIAAEDTHQWGSPNCPLAGEIGALEGVRLVLASHGGSGRHFMSHFGADPARAIVIGLGGVGRGALRTLLGLGLSVVGLDISAVARKEAALTWHDRALQVDHVDALPRYLADADLICNCVLWDKSQSDHLLSRAMLADLKKGVAIVDISCDTAGAVETCRATSWDDPVYEVDGVRHFCVDNIPGSVPVTASAGYAQAILPMILEIAELGAIEACRRNSWLARGLTTCQGQLLLEEAARVQDRPLTPLDAVLGNGRD